jgi:hypothetical protein
MSFLGLRFSLSTRTAGSDTRTLTHRHHEEENTVAEIVRQDVAAEDYDQQRDDAYGTDPYAFEGDY